MSDLKTSLIVIFFSLMSLASCTGSRKYYKAAQKLEKQGLINEAAGFYMESLQRKPGNTNAQIKLKETGQKYVNSLSSKFFKEYNSGLYDNCIETFDKLKEFTVKASNYHVELNFPDTYTADYDIALENYLSKHYTNVQNAVYENNFQFAYQEIQKIKKYKPNYKNTSEYEVTSFCEPIYLELIKDMESKNYEAAKLKTEKISAKKSNYKDIEEISDLVTGLLKVNVLIVKPKLQNEKEKEIEEQLFNRFLQNNNAISGKVKLYSNSPFLANVDIDQLYASGNIDLMQAIKKASKLNYFLTYDVKNFQVNEPKTKALKQVAYQKIKEIRNEVPVVVVNRIPYYEYNLNKIVCFDLKYSLISLETNQFVVANTENCFAKDVVEYNEFQDSEINTNNLSNYFPYDPLTTPAIVQYNPATWRNKFNGKREFKSTLALRKEAETKAVSVLDKLIGNQFFR